MGIYKGSSMAMLNNQMVIKLFFHINGITYTWSRHIYYMSIIFHYIYRNRNRYSNSMNIYFLQYLII